MSLLHCLFQPSDRLQSICGIRNWNLLFLISFQPSFKSLLTARSDKGVFDLFTDDTGESLFTFADADVDKFSELMARYFRSRIDLEKLECLEPEEDTVPRQTTSNLPKPMCTSAICEIIKIHQFECMFSILQGTYLVNRFCEAVSTLVSQDTRVGRIQHSAAASHIRPILHTSIPAQVYSHLIKPTISCP